MNAIIYLSTGALLLPLATAVVLSEYRLLAQRQAESREVFSDADAGRDDGSVTLTNRQIAATALAFVLYCVLLLQRNPHKLLAIWLGLGVYLLATGVMLLAGLREWLETEHIARTIVIYLSIALGLLAAALMIHRRPTMPRFWGATAYAFFLLPACVLLGQLAFYGGVEWLHARPAWDDETIGRWLMLNGVLFSATALWSERSHVGFVRAWAPFVMFLVPVHLLGPMNLLIDKGGTLLAFGDRPVTTYELAAAMTSLAHDRARHAVTPTDAGPAGARRSHSRRGTGHHPPFQPAHLLAIGLEPGGRLGNGGGARVAVIALPPAAGIDDLTSESPANALFGRARRRR